MRRSLTAAGRLCSSGASCTVRQRAFLSEHIPRHPVQQPWPLLQPRATRSISTTPTQNKYELKSRGPDDTEANATNEERDAFDKTIATDKERQMRAPWMREGADRPPVSRQRSAGAMVKGKLLTTPARLMKLILPLTIRDHNTDRKDVEPLALLVHPQQPLSYLERLIQAELPMRAAAEGEKPQIPSVNFWAADSMPEDEMYAFRQARDEQAQDSPSSSALLSEQEHKFVKWSKSTELGDFIRDAARAHEFEIEIDGAPEPIRVGVPSFGDRTYYLRTRLRKRAGEIAGLARIKTECDKAAYRAAQNVAYAGFGSILAWGGAVAWLTFCTDLGWDVMEPVTYLVGLAGVLIGYLWFLLNRREASYQAAMSLTVSRRQQAQYLRRGFDLQRYTHMLDEATALRREIMAIANEYDVEWSEKDDTQDEGVIKALKEHRRGGGKNDDDAGKQRDDDNDDNDAQDDDARRRPERRPIRKGE